MKITLEQDAGAHNRWSPHAFDAALHRPIAITDGTVHLGTAVLRRVTYTPNGRKAILLIEISA
jgi:hypothetical protein